MTYITPKPPKHRKVDHPDPQGPFVVGPRQRGRVSEATKARRIREAQVQHPELFTGSGRETVISTNPDLALDKIVPRGEFLVPSTDEHGHAATLVFRLPPKMSYLCEAIVATREFPFSTKSDLARWALHLGLKYLSDLTRNKRISNYHSMLSAALTMARVSHEEANFKTDLDKMMATIDALLMSGNTLRARRTLADIAGKLGAIDDPEWRDRYLRVLHDRFPDLLDKKLKKRKGGKK